MRRKPKGIEKQSHRLIYFIQMTISQQQKLMVKRLQEWKIMNSSGAFDDWKRQIFYSGYKSALEDTQRILHRINMQLAKEDKDLFDYLDHKK